MDLDDNSKLVSWLQKLIFDMRASDVPYSVIEDELLPFVKRQIQAFKKCEQSQVITAAQLIERLKHVAESQDEPDCERFEEIVKEVEAIFKDFEYSLREEEEFERSRK